MGGGDSGDGGAAAQRQADETRKQSARNAINQLFGIAPGMQTTTLNTIQAIPAPAKPAVSNYQGAAINQPGGIPSANAAPAPVSYRPTTTTNTAIAYDPASATANETARESGYSDLAQRVKDYYQPQMQDDRAAAERELGFALARSGQTGSSSEVEGESQIGKNWDSAIRDLEAKATGAVNTARSSDESKRLSLLNSVNAGLDQGSALSAANTQLQQSLNASLDAAKGGTVGNLFNNLAILNNASSTGDARTNARVLAQKLLSPSPGQATGGFNGTVVNQG